MHQWKISSWIIPNSGNGSGSGFPYEYLEILGIPQNSIFNIPLENGETPYNIFWKNFVYNYPCSIENINRPIWQHAWKDHIRAIVEITKEHPSTIGYSLINEPFEADNISIKHIEGLGNYNSYIAAKIRELTYKKIIFTEFIHATSIDKWGGLGNRDKALILLIPRYQNGSQIGNIIFEYHIFGNNGFTENYIEKANNIENKLLEPYNLDTIITEWSNKPYIELTEEGIRNYLQQYKDRGYGWFYFNYDPNYPWTIKNKDYSDRVNLDGQTYKRIFMNILS